MRRNALFSPARISVIAGNTFTQLVRMKVFYFLAVFAVLILLLNFYEGPWTRVSEDSAERVLIDIKGWGMGVMALFSTIFSIAATALLIPKDLEDRTLYTILCKPVPRLDYLLGKLLGVLLLVGISLLLMDALLCIILYLRTDTMLAEEIQRGEARRWPKEYLDLRLESIRQQGVTWSLQAGMAAIFFKAVIMAAIALLISTFSSSTLFTIVISVVIYCIGHFTADARNYWLHTQGTSLSTELKYLSQGVALVFPDFQLFNIIDAAVEGKTIEASVFKRLLVLTLFYTGIYSVLSWFTFRKKEF